MDLDKALDYARAVGLSDRAITAAVRAAADQVRFAAQAAETVRLTNPNLDDRTIDVHPESVDQYLTSGWQVEQPPGLTDTESEADKQAAAAREALETPEGKT